MVHIWVRPAASPHLPCERASRFSPRIHCHQLHIQLFLHRIPTGNKESEEIYRTISFSMSTYQSYAIRENDCCGRYGCNTCGLELVRHLDICGTPKPSNIVVGTLHQQLNFLLHSSSGGREQDGRNVMNSEKWRRSVSISG